MKALASLLLALLMAVPFAGTAGARVFLEPGDIARSDTSQAILTLSTPEAPGRVRALRFPSVPDLQSCFSLAHEAAAGSRGESSVTCINERGIIAATYFCAWDAQGNSGTPRCRAVTP